MNDDIRELYQQVIIDHGRNPRHFGPLPHCTHRQEGFNPLCGDHLYLYLQVMQDKIIDARFEGEGCAISTASASLMTQAIIGLSVAEARGLFHAVHDMVVRQGGTEHVGKLAVLQGVCAFPARAKCATLPWHTLEAALSGDIKTVSTE